MHPCYTGVLIVTFIGTALGTTLAARNYQIGHRENKKYSSPKLPPKRTLETGPIKFLILPAFLIKNNVSKKSSFQNGKSVDIHEDHLSRYRQRMVKALQKLPMVLQYKSNFPPQHGTKQSQSGHPGQLLDASEKAHLRAKFKPRYFHGGLFAPGLSLPAYHGYPAPPRPVARIQLPSPSFVCSNPLTAYLPLGQIQCAHGQRQKRGPHHAHRSRSTPQPTKPNIRPRRESPNPGSVHNKHRQKRQEAAFKVYKRGPGCMRRCLEAGLLHPAQCHALC